MIRAVSVVLRIIVALLLLSAAPVMTTAQEPPKPPAPALVEPPQGCAIYANYLKGQRDTLEAQLANALAELAVLKKAAEAKAAK